MLIINTIEYSTNKTNIYFTIMSLKNKTILVTGASKGIGYSLALLLAERGANLGLVARTAHDLMQLKTQIEARGGKAQIFVGDVADANLAYAVCDALKQTFGSLDAVINNAGFGIFGSTENISAADWDDVMNVNVKGTFLFCKAALPYFRESGGGHIVNVASDVAKRVFDGGSLYCASKYAQDAFSMSLRKEVRKDNIKVSVIYSGLVDTHFHAHEQGDPKAVTWLQADDVAQAIIYVLEAPAHVVIDELMLHPISQDY